LLPFISVLFLALTHSILYCRESHIDKKIMAQLVEAKKKSKANDKKGALFCLKRKKMFESEINKIQGARMTLEQQILTLESATVNLEVVKGMQAGVTSMKQMSRAMDVDKVDDLMGEIKEGMDNAEDISNIISQPVGEPLDDEDLLAELNEMEEQDLEAALLDAPSIPAAAAVAAPAPAASIMDFPAVPDHAVPTVQVTGGDVNDEELRALQELEASMAM
jgi:charged multivesicular body protein 4